MTKRKPTTKEAIDPMPDGHKPLTEKQELFCVYFASDERFFGNGTKAYQAAYPESGYEAARTGAKRLLFNAHICSQIRILMDAYVTDEVVDAELASVIKQNGDLSAKVAAVREFNAVKGRVVKNVRHSGTVGHVLLKADDKTYKEIIRDEAKRLGIIK